MKTMHSDEEKKIKTEKKAKVRATRKDKGVPKKSTAAKLLNLIAPKEIERAIIAGQGDTIYLHYDREENGVSDEDESPMQQCLIVNESQMMEMVQA